jgi:hypothetical protein
MPPEDLAASSSAIHPDAFLVDAAGRVRRVIESAGRYDAAQVESFHEHCVESDLPYELW